MVKSKLKVSIVLDMSGSMADCQDSAVSAVNEYVKTLADNDEIKAKVSVTKFNTEKVDTSEYVRAKDFTPLVVGKTYVPAGMTPLYDAIGRAIIELDKLDAKASALVIMTDGFENSSREYTKDQIGKLIRDRQYRGWQVIYLGADHDAMAAGAALGVAAHSTMLFNKGNLQETRAALYASNVRYAGAGGGAMGQAAGSFTNEERASASGGSKTSGGNAT